MKRKAETREDLIAYFFRLTNATDKEIALQTLSISKMDKAQLSVLVASLQASLKYSSDIYNNAIQNYEKLEGEQNALITGDADSIQSWLWLSLNYWLFSEDRSVFHPFHNYFRSDESVEIYIGEILGLLNSDQLRIWIKAVFAIIQSALISNKNLPVFKVLVSLVELTGYKSELELTMVRKCPERTLSFLATSVIEPRPEIFISALGSAKKEMPQSWFHLLDRYECVIETLMSKGELKTTDLSDFGQEIINAVGESEFADYSKKMVFDGLKYELFARHTPQTCNVDAGRLKHSAIEIPGGDALQQLIRDFKNPSDRSAVAVTHCE